MINDCKIDKLKVFEVQLSWFSIFQKSKYVQGKTNSCMVLI